MLAKFSGLDLKGPYVSLEKEKQNLLCCARIKRAREIRKISCRGRATTSKKCTKMRDVGAKMIFLRI